MDDEIIRVIFVQCKTGFMGGADRNARERTAIGPFKCVKQNELKTLLIK